MRFTRLALVVALTFGAVGATRGQDIRKEDPSWLYMSVRSNLTVAIKKNGVAMASLNFLPGTLVAVSDGKPVAGRRDFQGTFELRALPIAEAKAGPAATMMNTAPLILKVEGVEAHVENRQ
jgi:hypothetical protein